VGDYTATITWGDGSTEAGTVGTAAGGNFAVTGWHIYPAVTNSGAPYTWSVTVRDAGGSSLAASGTVTVSFTVLAVSMPPDTAQCSCSDHSGTPVRSTARAGGNPAGRMYSVAPVRYADGAIKLPLDDGLTSDGYGTAWGQARTWDNAPGYSAWSWNGFGTVDDNLPALIASSNLQTVEVATAGGEARFFDLVSGNYVERFFLHDLLQLDTVNRVYVFTDEAGNQFRFDDFEAATWPARRQGQISSLTDPYGNVTQVTAWTADGKVAEVQRTGTSGGSTVTESYLYGYFSGGATPGFLQSVTLRRQTNGGAWSTVRQATYSYYDGVLPHGNWGDLQKAVLSDGAGNVLDTQYYRYWVAGVAGGVDLLKYRFSAASYGRLVTAVGGNPIGASDAQVAPYADNYFNWDFQLLPKVTTEVAQGLGCSACAGGLGTFTYAYTTSTNPVGFNSWATKTVETLPDGNSNTVYSNAYGEVMLAVYQDAASGLTWDTFDQYDGAGRIILQAEPSAVTGYSESYADLLHNQSGSYQYLSNTSGLLEQDDWYATTTATETAAGGVAGYLQDVKLKHGQSDPGVLQEGVQYYAHALNGGTLAPVASDTAYRNADGTGAETTSYAYTWQAGTYNGMVSQTVTAPVISAAQNGPGTADVSTVFLDGYGRPAWTKDADGFLTYTAYDLATGAVVTAIDDVNTALTSEFTGLPAGWSTPAGGGLNLLTVYTVDALGRDTQETDPDGNVTFRVYNDPSHWERVYRGWNASTGTPTGPTEMVRQDRAGGYDEQLTMTATPHLTNGAPDGTEAVSGLQTLSRQYTNAAGQYVEADDYFNLAGVTYSTASYLGALNTNY
jgi:hypothetical protein